MARVKICGLCRAEDARAAVDAGADCIGVILAPGHRRTRTYGEAAEIYGAAAAPRVGVFVDPDESEIREAVLMLELDAIQLHGDESIGFVERVRGMLRDLRAGSVVWKSVRVRSPEQAAAELAAWSPVADAVLLDGWSPSAHGGAGVSFDWHAMRSLVHAHGRSRELVVAGGLTPENVAGVIRILDPDIVDVSSGVEEEPGRKSVERMRAFIAAAKQSFVAQPAEE